MAINVAKKIIMKTLNQIFCLFFFCFFCLACSLNRNKGNKSDFIKNIDTVRVTLKVSLIDTSAGFLNNGKHKAIAVELLNKNTDVIASGGFNCIQKYNLSYFHQGKYIHPIYIAEWSKECSRHLDTLFGKTPKIVVLPIGFNNYYEKPYPLDGDSLVVYFENTGMNLTNKRYVVVEGKGLLRF
jgi:hypothetical protein